MAKVTGVSLETIRSLAGAITFKAFRGQIIASKRMRKIGPNRSPRVLVMARRMKVANYYLKTLSAEVVDAWRAYTLDTDWTWKDAFTSAFLKAWSENNAPPIVITEMSFSWDGADAKLQFQIAEWYYGEDFGYGTDGYGTCPYGTPADLTVDQPHAITPEYRFGFYPKLGREEFEYKGT